MRKGPKIIFILCSSLVIFLFSVYTFLIFEGKVLVIGQLENLTQRKVSIGYFDIAPPFNLKIKDLNIEGMAKIESLEVSPSVLRFLLGKTAFNKIRIKNPEFVFEKLAPALPVNKPQAAVQPEIPAQGVSGKELRENVSPALSSIGAFLKKGNYPNLIFKRVTIEQGKIDFIDRTVSKEGLRISVTDINLSLKDLYFPPYSANADFVLSGRMPWGGQNPNESGKVEISGRANLDKRDILAKVRISDIDGVYLYPYYAQWVDLEKARIEKAKLNFNSDIRGADNLLTAECHLELTDIVFKQRAPQEHEQKEEKIATTVIDMFKTLNEGRIVLDFTLRTKMDRPEFGFGDIQMAFEDTINRGRQAMGGFGAKDALMVPVKLVEGTIKTSSGISKLVLNGISAVGNEIKQIGAVIIEKSKK